MGSLSGADCKRGNYTDSDITAGRKNGREGGGLVRMLCRMERSAGARQVRGGQTGVRELDRCEGTRQM